MSAPVEAQAAVRLEPRTLRKLCHAHRGTPQRPRFPPGVPPSCCGFRCWLELPAPAIFGAIRNAESAEVRGGAIYDFLHLITARKAKARVPYTLNVRHLSALVGAGDPPIKPPP